MGGMVGIVESDHLRERSTMTLDNEFVDAGVCVFEFD